MRVFVAGAGGAIGTSVYNIVDDEAAPVGAALSELVPGLRGRLRVNQPDGWTRTSLGR